MEATMRQILAATAVMLAVAIGPAYAAGQLGGVTDGAKKAGEVTKDTAQQAGEVTKDAVKTAGQETQKGVKATKDAVTGKYSATCVDGSRHTAKTEKAARGMCKKHGGVAK
jgi:hypothetical protein